jgi:two-component system CheB/CheR fusion protein
MTTRKKRPGKTAPPNQPADAIANADTPAPDSESATPPFPIVGIGASAGGLSAFEAFFSSMHAAVDTGMAFVLVQHLAPDHKSILSEIIQRYTSMQVFEAQDGMKVQPNCVYIIPPGYDMAFLGGTLQLLEPSAPHGQRLPIDFFFRSLAQDQGERAIGIVLSGTGSDGTLGLRAIKGGGGMVMAQDPESTEYDGMPRSAIATGLVDFELPPAEMPGQLIAYVTHAFGMLAPLAAIPALKTENALRKIFILLRSQTGHDFSQYKPSTINRRIERRMAVQQIETLDGYIKYLQQTPAEVDALFRDMLIGVTNFFRDPEAFAALEKQVIPKLFANKPANSIIRIWVPGCSTGEEAYSLAILLVECMETLRQSFSVQVFATDIDSQAIGTARAGVYPASIAVDISAERRARFFTPEPNGSAFRINKGIRDMLIFSEQDMIKDPPFSRLDIISCRNLLIYLGGELQKRIIPLFHYALNPGGMLFLGTSETVGDCIDLYTTLDRKQKIYQRKEGTAGVWRTMPGHFQPALTAIHATRPQVKKPVSPSKLPLRELTEQALLQQVVPAGALVTNQGDILYLHGRTGMYLEPAQGEAGASNILTMAREGLRHELAVALHNAVQSHEAVHVAGLRVKTNSHFTSVNLTVSPAAPRSAASPEAPLYLVILKDAPEPASSDTSPEIVDQSAEADARIAILRQELEAKDEYLQAANEELETSNEELKSSNEEMQAVNEELQSTNEELETSKEELQSVNEELSTVNNELQTKVADLTRVNNDMNNLLAGTGIGTVFVDFGLHILRFTPAASEIINLIRSDIGRPVSHIVLNLVDYNTLIADTQSVLDTLIPKELEVQTIAGRWYTMRIMPYRTLENVIEGAVITFVDITEIKNARDELRKANELLRLAAVVRDASDAITVQDLDGRIIAWNPGAERMYGWTEAEALAMNVYDRIPESQREGAVEKLAKLSRAETLAPYSTQRIAKDGTIVEVSIISTALVNDAKKMYAIATTERANTKENSPRKST